MNEKNLTFLRPLVVKADLIYYGNICIVIFACYLLKNKIPVDANKCKYYNFIFWLSPNLIRNWSEMNWIVVRMIAHHNYFMLLSSNIFYFEIQIFNDFEVNTAWYLLYAINSGMSYVKKFSDMSKKLVLKWALWRKTKMGLKVQNFVQISSEEQKKKIYILRVEVHLRFAQNITKFVWYWQVSRTMAFYNLFCSSLEI